MGEYMGSQGTPVKIPESFDIPKPGGHTKFPK